MLNRIKVIFGGVLLLSLCLGFTTAHASVTWEQTGGPEGGHVRSIAINPKNSQILYIGNLYGGVYKSNDGGNSWKAVNNGLPYSRVMSLAIDPTNPNTIYAGTYDYGVKWLHYPGHTN